MSRDLRVPAAPAALAAGQRSERDMCSSKSSTSLFISRLSPESIISIQVSYFTPVASPHLTIIGALGEAHPRGLDLGPGNAELLAAGYLLRRLLPIPNAANVLTTSMGIENSLTAHILRKIFAELQSLAVLGLTKLEIDPKSLSAGSLDLPIVPVARLVGHLQSTNVHDTLFPFVRFGCVHALRVALGWAQASKNAPKGRAALLSLAGYLVMACECPSRELFRTCRRNLKVVQETAS